MCAMGTWREIREPEPAVTKTGTTALVAMLGFLLSGCDDTDTTQATVQPEPPSEQEMVTEAFGVVKALSVRSIYVDLPAMVAKVHVSAAQLVERGELLVTLDLEEYETLLAARETTLAIERLALQRLEQNLKRENKRFSTGYQSTRNQLAAREAELVEMEREHAEKSAAVERDDDSALRSLRIDLEGAQADGKRPLNPTLREG